MLKLIPKHQIGGPNYFNSGIMHPLKDFDDTNKKIRLRLYRNVTPQGYSNFTSRLINGVLLNNKDKFRNTVTDLENAMWAKYLNLTPGETGGLNWKDYLEETDKRPSKGNINLNRKYYKIIKGHNPLQDDDYSKLKEGESTIITGNGAGMGTYTISKGNGYKSYHDIWDINPLKGVNSKVPKIILWMIPDFDFGKIIGAQEYGIYDKE